MAAAVDKKSRRFMVPRPDKDCRAPCNAKEATRARTYGAAGEKCVSGLYRGGRNATHPEGGCPISCGAIHQCIDDPRQCLTGRAVEPDVGRVAGDRPGQIKL